LYLFPVEVLLELHAVLRALLSGDRRDRDARKEQRHAGKTKGAHEASGVEKERWEASIV